MVRGMVCAIAIVDAERRRCLLRRGGRSGSRPRRGDVRGGLGAAPARVRRGRTRVRGVEGVRGCERRASDGDHCSDRRGVVRARRRRRRSFDDGAARERLWTPRGLAIVPPGKIGSPRDARGDRCARRRREARSRVGRETLDERLGTRARVHRRRRDRRGVVGRRRERGRERRRRRRRIRKYRGQGGVRVRGNVDGRCGRERYASPVFRRARPSFGRASTSSRDKTRGSGCAGRHRLRLGGARARHRAQVADRSSGGGADTTQTCAVGGTGGAAQTSGGGGGEPKGHRRARAAARRARRSTRRGRHRRRPRAARRRAVVQHRTRPSDRVRGPRSGSTQELRRRRTRRVGGDVQALQRVQNFRRRRIRRRRAGTVGSDCGVERVDVHGRRAAHPRVRRERDDPPGARARAGTRRDGDDARRRSASRRGVARESETTRRRRRATRAERRGRRRDDRGRDDERRRLGCVR